MLQQSINAEIITIGDEILIGQIIDTNSAWMGQQLNQIGINVYQITSISDNSLHILKALELATSRVDLILITGGLGPTRDDITKQTITGYFKSKLVRNEQVLKNVQKILGIRGIKMNELNIRQADVPDNCQIILNSCGTAPGLWFEKNRKVYVFMPGVPFEMKAMMSDILLPQLKEYFKTSAIVHKTLMLCGVAESILALHIEAWEVQLPANLKLAYLPSPGIIRLRLTAKGDSQEGLSKVIGEEIEKVLPLVKEWHYGYDDETLEMVLGNLLNDKGKTLSTAESCTGGKVASMITAIPGSSGYYKGTVVAYANEIKNSMLGISSEIIATNGAVSQLVVEAMARNAVERFNTDYAIGISGIAGPDGGSVDKPVGTIWIAVASRSRVMAKKFLFGHNNRERNIIHASVSALNELRKFIQTGG